MRRPTTAAPLIVLNACALSVTLSLGLLPAPVFAGQEEVVTETITFNFVKPSSVLRNLQDTFPDAETSKPKSMIPPGITGTAPNDAARTLTITGTKASISELKQMVRFLDIKPRRVMLKTRLLETRLGPSGVRQRTLLQSSVLSAGNNQSVMTAISGMESEKSEKEEIFVTFVPHINSDRTISVSAEMQRRWEEEAKPRAYKTSAAAIHSKPNEWITLRTMSFSEDPNVQKIMQASGTPPVAAYPLYRLEVFSTEITN